jgi:hypothetical protein
VGVLGLAAAGLGYSMDHHHFFFAYLTAFTFWVSISLGALFFTMLHHLTGAKWSVVIRRLSESIMLPLPWMFLFAIPMFFGLHELYHWSHADAVAVDPILQWKSGYLNVNFFIIRTVIYFLIWSALALLLYRASLSQDKGHTEELAARMRKLSAGGMIIFALTTTFAGFDWLMSLEPHWYSTIFGVYYFAGGFICFLSVLAVFVIFLRSKGVLANAVTVEHHHDIGKLMLGFTIFWSYIAFSQYFLQWYGNIPGRARGNRSVC